MNPGESKLHEMRGGAMSSIHPGGDPAIQQRRPAETQAENEELLQERDNLLETAELHRLIMDLGLLGVAIHEIVLDASGRPVDYVFVSANPAFETHTGLPVAEVLGRRVTEVLPGIEKTSFIETYGRVVLSGEPVCFEQYSEPLNRHFFVTGYKIAEKRVATVFTDITQRKQAEEARRISEQKLAASEAVLAQAQQIAHVGSWILDLTTDQLTWSDETYRILGCQPQEFVPSYDAYFDFVHPEDRAAVHDAYADSLREGGAAYDMVHRLIRKDNGQVRHLHVRCQHQRDASGTVVRSIGMVHDITDQTLDRQQLQEEGQRLREAQAIAHLGSWDYDARCDNLTWSDETHRIFGTEPGTFEETYGAFLETVHPEDRPEVEKLYSRSLQDADVTYEIEHRLIRRNDGQERIVYEKCRHQRDEQGRVVRSLGIVHDITAIRKTEAEYRRTAEALQATNLRLQNILDHSPLLICEFDLDGRYLRANPAVSNMLNVSPSQLAGKTFDELFPQQTVGHLKGRIAEVLAAGAPIHVEDNIETRDGLRHFLTTLFPLRDQSGEFRSIGCIGYDVTELKTTTDLLREKEEHHRLLFETMAQGVVYQNAPDGAIVSANPASERILGLTLEQMLGKTSMDSRWHMIDEQGREVAGADHPSMVCLRTGRPQGPVVRGVFHPDKNEPIWLSITSIPLFRPGEAQPYQAYAVLEDITERMQTEEELRQRAERTAAQRNALTQMAFDETVTRSLSQALERLTGLVAEVLDVERVSVWMLSQDQSKIQCSVLCDAKTGHHLDQIVLDTADIPNYLAALRQDSRIDAEDVCDDPRVQELSRNYLTPHGITSLLDCAIQQDGTFLGVLSAEHRGARRRWHADEESFLSAMASLLSQQYASARRREAEESVRQLNLELEERVRQRTQALEQANKQLDAFSHSVSHDLRAPLRGISGLTNILLEDHAAALTEDGQKLCNMIHEGAESMRRMIESLLEFARTGRVDLRTTSIDVRALVDDIIGELVEGDRAAQVDFRVSDLPMCQGDYLLIRQVWRNLLANAVKYSSPREQPVISIDATREGDDVVYRVQDNGVGFDMQYASKLFGVFQRLHSSKDFEGTGVGLAIAQQIVRRHGGRIWAASEPKQGATFCFTLGGLPEIAR